jgi:hypothetical protein
LLTLSFPPNIRLPTGVQITAEEIDAIKCFLVSLQFKKQMRLYIRNQIIDPEIPKTRKPNTAKTKKTYAAKAKVDPPVPKNILLISVKTAVITDNMTNAYIIESNISPYTFIVIKYSLSNLKKRNS